MSQLAAIASRATRTFPLRTILVGVVCLSVGGGVAKAAPPIDIFRLADGTNTTQLAKVDASGNVAVSVSNIPATQNVAGTVAVSNLPATQTVAGTVAVSNFPATQQISGNVGDARVTTQIALDDLTLAGSLAVTTLHSTDGYTQARVTARAISPVSCATPLTIHILTPAWTGPGSFYPMELGVGTICGGNAYNAVFDVPGTDLYFSVAGTAGDHVVIATFGR